MSTFRGAALDSTKLAGHNISHEQSLYVLPTAQKYTSVRMRTMRSNTQSAVSAKAGE